MGKHMTGWNPGSALVYHVTSSLSLPMGKRRVLLPVLSVSLVIINMEWKQSWRSAKSSKCIGLLILLFELGVFFPLDLRWWTVFPLSQKVSSELASLEEVKPTLLICHHLSHLLKVSPQIMCQFVGGSYPSRWNLDHPSPGWQVLPTQNRHFPGG